MLALPSVLESISFKARPGEVTAITGPSGCGKSTLLNLTAGVLRPNQGSITHENAEGIVKQVRCGYVFQNPTLIPWRSVMSNAIYGCELAGMNPAESEAAASVHLHALGLAEYRDSYPRKLSGGMQHRLAFVRMVVSGAPVLLLDEPFSNSDFKIRRELQKRLIEVVQTEQRVALLVSHDLEEMVRVASQIVVLSQRPARVLEIISLHDLQSRASGPMSHARTDLLPYVEQLEAAMLKASND